jgi:REP element-mobilizing transposase RayT
VATYLITFTSYGSHIPGQEGAIDRNHNRFGARVPEPRPKLRQYVDRSLKQASYEMEVEQRAITLKAIQEVCAHKGWFLHAVHVRSNHVHVVVGTDVAPELAMTAFKAYASRALNTNAPAHRARLRWTRHGSTLYLWSKDRIDDAVTYVLDGQGERMAWYEAPFRLSAP